MPNIEKREITDELRESYLDYAMSVIVSRALPDVRDGLKPVQRRILWTMWEEGLTHNAKFRKSANITGNCLARYHPHGDMAVYDALARMAQGFSLRYPLIQGQGNFGCFTGDTKIRLTDGRSLSFKELIKEAGEGKKHWTFSFNPQTKKIEIAEIKNPRLTRKSEKIIEITLDNGEKIKCTLDHLFMLRDGSYKKARDLVFGDSLMPLYTKLYKGDDKNLKGYEMIYQPIENSWEFTHHLADQYNLKNKIYKKNAGRIRHHKDFNKLNNNPDNILRIQWQDHWKYHKEIASKRHKNDPEYVKRLAEGRRKFIENNKEIFSQRAKELNKKLWGSLEFRKRHSQRIKEKWQDPEYKKYMAGKSSQNLKNLWQREDFRELMSKLKSEELRKRWQNENYRKIMSEWMRGMSLKLWSNPKHREYISKLMKERANNQDWRRRQSEISKTLWQNPEYRAKYPKDFFSKIGRKAWENPTFYEAQQEKAKKQWQNPEFREKIIETIQARSLKRIKEKPDFMKELTEKAKIALSKNWTYPEYKAKVIKSKILNYVYSLLNRYSEITPEIYEKERINNGTPKINNALNYFADFREIVSEAKKHNHKVIKIRLLRKKEDVYDLTIEPWHNFSLAAGVFVHNSIDGDTPAAQRYTEARLSKIAEELLLDIEKETVDWQANYDGTRQEPKVLPAKLPNLLLNGSVGIAVGMATNIPPHNLNEVVDALVYLINHPKANSEQLMQFIQGPDFPTGGIIYDKKAINEAYASGKGPITCRAKAEIEERKAGQFNIVITEIPYQVNKAELIIKIAELVQEKKIEGIRDLRDESDREGMRIVIELKNEANPQKILNQLYQYTDLQKDFHLNMIALTDGIQPQLLSLKEVLEAHLEHRRQVVERRAKFDLQKAKERAHILEGLAKALSVIDQIISTIKKSKDRSEAYQNLIKKFHFTEIQANAILEMRLQTLAALERQKIEDELKEKKKLINELQLLLKNPEKILNVIKEELLELKKNYGDERRTRVVASGLKEFKEEDLIPQEDVIITLSQSGYIKRVAPTTIRVQRRGGKGLLGSEVSEEDFITHFISANTHDSILFFTDQGRVFQTKVYEIPVGSRTSKGKIIQNFLEIPSNEKVSAIVAYATTQINADGAAKGGDADKRGYLSVDQRTHQRQSAYLVMLTKNGLIKKTSLDDFKNVRRSGMIAIKLQKGDELKWVKLSSGKDEIIVVTTQGQAIRFKESQLRPMGRLAAGVRAIKLKKGDFAAGLDIIKTTQISRGSASVPRITRGNNKISEGSALLVVTENGFAKQTLLNQYKIQSRGGQGIKTAKITSKTGLIISAKIITDEEELLALSSKGQIIRTKISDIRTAGRATSGVRIMKLKSGDKVAGIVTL